jgi:hypothetical protein
MWDEKWDMAVHSSLERSFIGLNKVMVKIIDNETSNGGFLFCCILPVQTPRRKEIKNLILICIE